MTTTQEQISEVQAQLQLEISQAELSEARRVRHLVLHDIMSPKTDSNFV